MLLDNPQIKVRLGLGACGAAHQVDVCKSSSQRVIFVPSAGNDLEFVEKCGNLVFVGIEMNAGPFAELVD